MASCAAAALIASTVYGGLAWRNRWWPFPAQQPVAVAQATTTASGSPSSSATQGGASTPSSAASGASASDAMNLSDDDQLDGMPDVSGDFSGAGSASMQYAAQSWIYGFTSKRPNARIAYNPTGTGAGLASFSTGALTWATTDRAPSGEQMDGARSVCSAGEPIAVPVSVDPILIPYRLDALNGEPLNLSVKTLAGILSGTITTWNDAAIAADNPHVNLPSTPITVVARADKSSSTLLLSQYLAKATPDAWPYQPSESWPAATAHQLKGASGVVSAVDQQDGAIGYVQRSSAQGSSMSTVRLMQGSTAVPYSPQAASRMADISFDAANKGNGGSADPSSAFDVAFGVTDAAAYPLITIDYMVGCSAYQDSSTGEFMKQWLLYVTSDAGQKAAAGVGLAPLSSKVRNAYAATIDGIR
ncbi:phosphate ABC transporter substrate-binding protein PstS [Bifidobacterium avesanii]|uniref:phosphate ABC transporter substrate-binding protein PstS n=1 Tax=Bifidobacterium avesanii TaxID=1798157 RepID=UPI001952D40F|nr:phosphate ABC transporter substrate-binding protein PstS [Bifidobacterium avesanii]